MVAYEPNRNAYAEMFDMDRLEQIAEDVQHGRGARGHYSDLECLVYLLMQDLKDGNSIHPPRRNR